MVGFNKMILLPFEKKIIVAYRPNNGTFVHLLHDHISGLCRFHSKSIFLFMTFDFVNVTIKSRFHVGSTIKSDCTNYTNMVLQPVKKERGNCSNLSQQNIGVGLVAVERAQKGATVFDVAFCKGSLHKMREGITLHVGIVCDGA